MAGQGTHRRDRAYVSSATPLGRDRSSVSSAWPTLQAIASSPSSARIRLCRSARRRPAASSTGSKTRFMVSHRVAFSGEGDHLFIASQDGNVPPLGPAGQGLLRPVRSSTGSSLVDRLLARRPDARLGKLRRVDQTLRPHAPKRITHLSGPPGIPGLMEFSPEGGQLATVVVGKAVQVIDLKSGVIALDRPLKPVDYEGEPVASLDGRIFLYSLNPGRLEVIELLDRGKTWEVDCLAEPFSSHVGTRLPSWRARAHAPNLLSTHELRSGRTLHQIPLQGAFHIYKVLAVSRDGHRVIVTCEWYGSIKRLIL